MRKLLVTLLILGGLSVMQMHRGMAQDILKQIIHGSVNTNPDLSEVQADQSVVVSLRSAILILACTNRNPIESAAQAKCVKEHKSEIMTIGDLSEPSFKSWSTSSNPAIFNSSRAHFKRLPTGD